MTRVLVILVAALVLEAWGVVLLSKGSRELGTMKEFSVPEISRLAGKAIRNRSLLLGILLEAIFFAALLYLLNQRDVSFVWPLTSLGLVITTIAAKVFLHEKVDSLRWVGVGLIVLGASLITWSERQNKSKTPPASHRSQ